MFGETKVAIRNKITAHRPKRNNHSISHKWKFEGTLLTACSKITTLSRINFLYCAEMMMYIPRPNGVNKQSSLDNLTCKIFIERKQSAKKLENCALHQCVAISLEENSVIHYAESTKYTKETSVHEVNY